MKQMLITGGTGFIGSHLCNKFIRDYYVTSYSDFDRVSGLFPMSAVDNIKGDVCDFDKLYAATQRKDIIIHCAAVTGIYKVLEDPYRSIESNILGDINIFKSLKDRDIKHVIVFSSGESLGTNTNYKPNHIDFPLYDDRWCYGVSKLVSEYLSISNYRRYGNPITVVRPFNVYGPGQVGGGAIRTFIKQALNNDIITVHGDGSQVRSWDYIDDFVEGIKLIVDNPDKSIGKIYNIGDNRTVISILELARLIVDLLGSKSIIDFTDPPFVDVEYRVPELSEISKLGFNNYTILEDGILKTAEWFKAHI